MPSAIPVEASAKRIAPATSTLPRRMPQATAARRRPGAPNTMESANAELFVVKNSLYVDETPVLCSSASGASSNARGMRRPRRRAGWFRNAARSFSSGACSRSLRRSSTTAGATAGAENASASAPQQAASPMFRAAPRTLFAIASTHAAERRPAIKTDCGSPAYAISATAAPAQA